jgi:hypothetical protein
MSSAFKEAVRAALAAETGLDCRDVLAYCERYGVGQRHGIVHETRHDTFETLWVLATLETKALMASCNGEPRIFNENGKKDRMGNRKPGFFSGAAKFEPFKERNLIQFKPESITQVRSIIGAVLKGV